MLDPAPLLFPLPGESPFAAAWAWGFGAGPSDLTGEAGAEISHHRSNLIQVDFYSMKEACRLSWAYVHHGKRFRSVW